MEAGVHRRASYAEEWRAAALHAAPVSLLVLLLFYYWFGLVFPLAHHLTTPAQYRSISALSNLFASHGGLQVLTWAVAAGLALGITWLRVGSVGSRKHVLLGG